MLETVTSTLSDLKDKILVLDKNVHAQSTIDGNITFMKELVKQDIPKKLLVEILDDPDVLREIASRSYEHINHFSKIVIIDNPDPRGYRLTAHLWTGSQAKKAAKEELIHSHRFSLWSHIFCGQMTSQNFLEVEKHSYERKDFRRYVYRPSKTGNIHSCNFDKIAQLERQKDNVVSAGDVYYLNYLTTHRVVFPQDDPCLCTFVLRGPREREFTHTYNTFYPERGIESSVPMMKPSELKKKLEFILESAQ